MKDNKKDRVEDIYFYELAMQLWNEFWDDSDKLLALKDVRAYEIVRQLTRSTGSISANIEEGYGRGFGKEYPRFLKISRGSARETKGWYKKCNRLLSEEIVKARTKKLDIIIGALTKTINSLEGK